MSSSSPPPMSSSSHRQHPPYGLSDVATECQPYNGSNIGTSVGERQQQLLHQEEREDALEYFIKFPKLTADNDFALLDGNEENNNVPIVMLLGWAGCQDRYLMKYSKIYEERGYVDLCLTIIVYRYLNLVTHPTHS